MPVIRLSDATFVELKTISTWLSAKTPSETIDRLVREKLDALGLERDTDNEPEVGSSHKAGIFDKAPGLSFTRLKAAKVGGAPIQKADWASLLLNVVSKLKSKGLSRAKLVSELQIPSKIGEYSSNGYRFYPDLGISMQGQSAQGAWKEVERIANKWGITVEAEFQWRRNDRAQHPGRAGILRAGGK